MNAIPRSLLRYGAVHILRHFGHFYVILDHFRSIFVNFGHFGGGGAKILSVTSYVNGPYFADCRFVYLACLKAHNEIKPSVYLILRNS